MLFRALTTVCAVSAAVALSGCITGETVGSLGSCNPNAMTLDGNPVPGNGDSCEHWEETWCAQRTNFRHLTGTVGYWAFNTNSDYPPYETFWGDQWSRAMYQVGEKFDEHLFNHDWGDPFITCEEPCCDPPRCTMRYEDPCKGYRYCPPARCDGYQYDYVSTPCEPCRR
jgi:hypothetical protein